MWRPPPSMVRMAYAVGFIKIGVRGIENRRIQAFFGNREAGLGGAGTESCLVDTALNATTNDLEKRTKTDEPGTNSSGTVHDNSGGMHWLSGARSPSR